MNAFFPFLTCFSSVFTVFSGEMFDFIVAQKRVNEVQACKFFHQIVEGVDEIHKNEITHRDLKPEVSHNDTYSASVHRMDLIPIAVAV